MSQQVTSLPNKDRSFQGVITMDNVSAVSNTLFFRGNGTPQQSAINNPLVKMIDNLARKIIFVYAIPLALVAGSALLTMAVKQFTDAKGGGAMIGYFSGALTSLPAAAAAKKAYKAGVEATSAGYDWGTSFSHVGSAVSKAVTNHFTGIVTAPTQNDQALKQIKKELGEAVVNGDIGDVFNHAQEFMSTLKTA